MDKVQMYLKSLQKVFAPFENGGVYTRPSKEFEYV